MKQIKKYISFAFVIMLCAVLLLCGCTKASTATLAQINDKYNSYMTKYGTYKDGTKTKIFNADGDVDLHSQTAYNADLYSKITTQTADGASLSLYNVLATGAEYQTILDGVSYFYKQYNWNATYEEVPQQNRTKVYQKVEDLSETLSQLFKTKEAFESDYSNQGEANSDQNWMISCLRNYLLAYQKLIDNYYQLNTSWEDMFTNYIVKITGDITTPEEMPSGAYKIVGSSYLLYLGEYYYQKHMVLNQNIDNRFAHKVLATKKEDGSLTLSKCQTYDEAFENYKAIKSLLDNLSEQPKSSDVLFYYIVAVQKLATLKTTIKNYKTAVSQINAYRQSHKMADVPTDSPTYQYVKYTQMADAEVINYQNFLISSLNFIASH